MEVGEEMTKKTKHCRRAGDIRCSTWGDQERVEESITPRCLCWWTWVMAWLFRKILRSGGWWRGWWNSMQTVFSGWIVSLWSLAQVARAVTSDWIFCWAVMNGRPGVIVQVSSAKQFVVQDVLDVTECDWLSTHSCMPLQQLPTVTKDANAHARLGYVRSQSLASRTTSPVETRGRHSRTLAKLKVHH